MPVSYNSSKNEIEEFIQSYPCKVLFCGWESDTYKLQKSGWQISSRQEQSYMSPSPTIRLALRHSNCNLYAMTSPVDIDYNSMYSRVGNILHYIEYLKNIVFNVQVVNSTYRIIEPMIGSNNFFNEFEPIDCTPQKISRDEFRLSEFKIFKPISKSKEIIIGPKNVQEALDLVLKLQDPEQEKIFLDRQREKDRQKVREEFSKIDADPGYDIKATIICPT